MIGPCLASLAPALQTRPSRGEWTMGVTYLTKDVGEYEQADSIEEVNNCDGDVERVRFLVHPRS